MSLQREVRERFEQVRVFLFSQENGVLMEMRFASLLSVSLVEIQKFMYGWGVDEVPANFNIIMPRLSRLVEIVDDLKSVVKQNYILTFLERPNAIFNNKRPCELLRSDEEFQRLKSVLYHLHAGDAV